MVSTSRSPPFEIFQEPITTFDHNEVQQAELALFSALGPLAEASQDSAIALESSYPEPSGLSPLKTEHRSSSPAASALRETDFNSVRIPPPQQETYRTDSLQKRATGLRSSGHIPSLAHSKVMFSSFQPEAAEKENAMVPPSSNSGLPQYTQGLYKYQSAPKRGLVDSAPLRDRSAKRTKITVTEPTSSEPLPDPSELPSLDDDGKKPSFSYAQLIGMAILRAPNRRLTLAQIYKWISDTFSHYSLSENGWQNSIRHNLSLNKAFIKQERPKDDPGKGNYWVIEQGMERQFLKDKNARRGTLSEGSTYHSLQEPVRPATAPSMGSLPPSSSRHIDSSRFPADDEELSSDATIPASDPAIHDGIDDHSMPPPTTHHFRSSPPRGEINSSPPQMPAAVKRADTPPRIPRFPSTSRSGGRKRKFASLGDSGYWSSIESSLPRGAAPRGVLLTSEADNQRPSMKRGRAEEEIARMRSSSFDSPTKARPTLKGVGPSSALASSPFRPFERPSRTPLTPPVVFKRPARPPKTISPNTNLRNHRKRIADMVGSPDKSLGLLEGSLWSPAPAALAAGQNPDDFAIWKDEDISKAFELMDSPVARGSPEKRSARRPNLGRAHTSSGILADITGTSAGNARLGAFASPRMIGNFKSPMRFFSPLKQMTSAPKLDPSPLRPGAAEFADENELFSAALNSDDSEEAGFDILSNFQKIGAAPSMPPPPLPGSIANGSPVKQGRPGLHRSSTSMF